MLAEALTLVTGNNLLPPGESCSCASSRAPAGELLLLPSRAGATAGRTQAAESHRSTLPGGAEAVRLQPAVPRQSRGAGTPWDTLGQQQQAARPPHLSTHPSGTAQQRCPGGGGRPPECPQAVPVRLTREQTLLRARRAAVLRQCRGSCSHLTPPRPPHLGTGAGLQHVEVSASAQLLAGGVEVAAQGAAGARREAETSQLLLQLWTQLQLFHSIPQHSTPWGCSTSTRGGRSPLKRWAEGAGQGSSFRTQHC